MGLYLLTRVHQLTFNFIELRSKKAAEQHSTSQGGFCRYEGAAGEHHPSDHVFVWMVTGDCAAHEHRIRPRPVGAINAIRI